MEAYYLNNWILGFGVVETDAGLIYCHKEFLRQCGVGGLLYLKANTF